MPTPERATTRIGFCPHCGNETPHHLLFVHEYCGIWYDSSTGERSVGEEEDHPSKYYVASCGTCDDLLVYHELLAGSSDFDTSTELSELTLVFPDVKNLPAFVPTAVREAYE